MCGDGTDEEDSGRWQPIIKSSFLYRWIHLTFVPDRVGDVEFPEVKDVRFNCCCERSEASGGWKGTKIGLQLAGSRININRRDPGRI